MRRFKHGNRDQILLLPPSLDEWLPEDHLARFILETVNQLDLSKFYEAYESGRGGQPPYDPGVMVSLLLYAYTTGVMSSRKIEAATWNDIAFRFITVNLHPDHDTIATFRKRHGLLIAKLFADVVQVAMQSKIVRLGHVSLDGTKVRANAAKGKRTTRERLEAEQKAIEELFGELLEEADRTDEQEDEEFGKGNNGSSLPASLKTKEQRAEAIARALKALNEQKEKQEREDPTGNQKNKREWLKGKKEVAKVNTTDTDSRTMRFSNGTFDEGYNTQIVVDDDHGIIVAADVCQDGGDRQQLLPMMLQVQGNTGWLPDHVTADTGYFSEVQLTDSRLRTVEFYVKPAKKKAAKPTTKVKITFSDQMQERMETSLGKSLYHQRMTLVEPVFGVIKHARGFRQFKLRGLTGVKTEWALICIAHNLRKMFGLSPKLAVLLR
jgi:transposase